APFSLDVIVHSTGAPVIRHWLHYYLTQVCRGDFARCPIRRLIMLAPANFGSRLAAQGKSTLAKLFRGGIAHGFQTGQRILEGLELGSPTLWELAKNDLFSGSSFYPVDPNRGPFVFILSGTNTYGELKGFVAKGANEDGSDGTIRASSAALNSIKLEIDYTQPTDPQIVVHRQANVPFPFLLVPGKNHSEIVPDDPDDDVHPTLQLMRKCLGVTNADQYQQVRLEFEQANAQFYAEQQQEGVDEGVHAYQQFLVCIRDDMGNDVTDYRLDLHVIDESIAQSTWSDDRQTLEKLRQYQEYTYFLQEQVIADVQPHSINTAYRTFFINLDRLRELQDKLRRDERQPYIAMNLDAIGPTEELRYDTDSLHYLPVENPIPADQHGNVDFFKANTSTLVEILIARVPSSRVIKLTLG
ncbi:MAG: hypothetical protein HY268_13180, partial [Deltaproteobacteria bacterium]|nr:hypothetical protein [Deltaproteobacteria bacterium]